MSMSEGFLMFLSRRGDHGADAAPGKMIHLDPWKGAAEPETQRTIQTLSDKSVDRAASEWAKVGARQGRTTHTWSRCPPLDFHQDLYIYQLGGLLDRKEIGGVI